MADINLEKKKGSIWPWIIGLLVLVAVIWLVVEAMDRDDDDLELVATDTVVLAPVAPPVTGTTQMAATELPREVQEFMQTCHGADASMDPGLQHEYTARCFELIAGSLRQIAERSPANPDMTAQIETVRQQALNLRQSEASSTDHMNKTRQAAVASAEAIASVQQALRNTTAPTTMASAEDVRQAAQQLQPSEPLLNQKDELTAFFREAGDALSEMARAGSNP